MLHHRIHQAAGFRGENYSSLQHLPEKFHAVDGQLNWCLENGIIGKLFNATILLNCGGIARMSFVLEADRAIIANASPRDLQFER
jgi:hypothetical protein